MAQQPRKPNRSELNYKAVRLNILTEHIARIAVALIHGTAYVLCAYILFKCIEVLAGRETKAEFLVKAIADFKANQWFAYLFGAGGAAWALNERRLRKKTTKRLQDRTVELEKKLDPKRSSSGLPPTGSTRSGDMP